MYIVLSEIEILVKIKYYLFNGPKPLMNMLNDLITKKEQTLQLNSDQYFIITGANTGIGFDTAMVLTCRFKYNVILACRNEQRGNKAKLDIERELQKKNINHVDVKYMKLDLSSLESVADFAFNINKYNLKIKGLIANAGIMSPPLEYTKEGHESQFGCNYLAHFLLVHLLKDNLIENGPSRIVLVSSEAHKSGYVNLNDLDFKHSLYNPFLGYAQSKACEVMFCYEFNRILKKEGLSDKLTINVVHPGTITTSIGANIPYLFNLIYKHVIGLLTLTSLEGATNQIYVACAEHLSTVSGKYFKHGIPSQSAIETYDPHKCKILYEKSMEMIKEFI